MNSQVSWCPEFGEGAVADHDGWDAIGLYSTSIAQEALLPSEPVDLNIDGSFQHLNTAENVATIDSVFEHQLWYHENSDISSTMMETNCDTAGSSLGDNSGLHLTDPAEQSQAIMVMEFAPWDQDIDLGPFTDHGPQSSLLHSQNFHDAPRTLAPLLLDHHPISLDTRESRAASTFNDGTTTAQFVPESGSIAHGGVEPAYNQQQHNQLHPLYHDVDVSAPAEESIISQEVATSVPTSQSRFRPLVPKQNPPGYEPRTSSDAGGRKRRRSQSPRTARLISNSGIPESCIDTFSITVCSEEAPMRRQNAPAASKRTKKKGSACKRCRDDRKKCSSAIPCERCRQIVLGHMVHQRVKRLQSSVIGWTCYFDSEIQDLNFFSYVAVYAMDLIFNCSNNPEIEKATFDEGRSHNINHFLVTALSVIRERGKQTFARLHFDLVNRILIQFSGLEPDGTLWVQVNDEVLEVCSSFVYFIIMVLYSRDIAPIAGLGHLTVLSMFAQASYYFFGAIAIVLGKIRKGKSITPASRMVLIKILNTMPIIVGPIFSMTLHEIIAEALKYSAKLYSEHGVGGENEADRIIINAAETIDIIQRLVCSGAFKLVHLAEMTAYWLQRLGAPPQVDWLEDERLTKLSTKPLLTTKNPRNAFEEARLFYRRLERCRQLRTVKNKLELLTSFDDANVDREITLAPFQDSQPEFEYSRYAAISSVYLIYKVETRSDDESGSDGDEMESDGD
ncbi:hypothetical protein QBC43DRAFT_317564 [Cladorrhinum sp. PSN259]|nr:hypothetical protein QBC43DRAFT_317564 [Cladorrhinum sp. PSN259]